MPKHIYDKDGSYKGKILSDEEHDKKQSYIRPSESRCYFCDKKMFDISLKTIDIKKELAENIFNELPIDHFSLFFKQKEKICDVCKGKLSAKQIKEIVARKRRERNVLSFGFIFCIPTSFFITIILNQEGLLTNSSLYNFLFFIILNAIFIHFFKKVVGKFYPISQK